MATTTSPNPHAVLAALADIERRSASETFATKRQYVRHSLRGEAILQTMEDASVDMRTIRVQLRDISVTGLGFITSEPIEPGTMWRVTFVIRNFTIGQHALAIRHCRRVHDGTYLSGGQFCVEPGLLHLMGFDPSSVNRGDADENAFLPPEDV